MKKYNWTCECGKIIFTSGNRPNRCPKCGEVYGFYPLYAKSRVNVDKFTPYMGKTEWHVAANAAMAEEACYNFNK